MVNRELDYIDFRDDDALRQYVDDAPSPAPGAPLQPAAPAEIFVMPSPAPRPGGRPRKNPARSADRLKRSSLRVTIPQRKNLLAAFRKSRVTPFQHLVRHEIELDAAVPTRVVRSDLEAIVGRYGGNVEALGPEVVDEAVRLRNNRAPVVDGGGNPHVGDGGDGTTEEEAAEEDPHAPAVHIPSVTALNAFLRGESGMDITREIPVFTMKRETVRGASANTSENKEAADSAIVTLQVKMI